MMRLACILAVLAAPASAQRAADADLCTAGWHHLLGIGLGYPGSGFFDFLIPDEVLALRDFTQKPVADGWCRVIAPQITGNPDIDRLEWRAVPMTFSDDPDQLPSQVQARISGTRSGEYYEFSATLSHVPADGLLILDQINLELDDKPVLTASAVIGGAFFSDPRAAQMSLPGLHLDQFAVSAEITPQQAGLVSDDQSRDDMAGVISGLSFQQLDRRSRSELMDFARDLPDADGAMDVTFASDRGLGWMQLIATGTQDDADLPAFLLDGARVTFDWQPN